MKKKYYSINIFKKILLEIYIFLLQLKTQKLLSAIAMTNNQRQESRKKAVEIKEVKIIYHCFKILTLLLK